MAFNHPAWLVTLLLWAVNIVGMCGVVWLILTAGLWLIQRILNQFEVYEAFFKFLVQHIIAKQKQKEQGAR